MIKTFVQQLNKIKTFMKKTKSIENKINKKTKNSDLYE